MRALRLFLTTTLAVLIAADAFPCVCPESGDISAAYRQAAAVFVGRVISLEVAPSAAREPGEDDMVATLQVERRWKGPRTSTLRVRTCGTQATVCTCGVDFQLGARYVVFASGKRLETTSCDLTRLALAADDLIREVEMLPKETAR
jgi:hypothetical protein